MFNKSSHGSVLRPLMVCCVALCLCAGLAPDLRADAEVYHVQLADLLNMPGDCGGGSRYSDCTGATKPGFQFTDALPAGSVVDAVTVEFNHGVQCTSPSYEFEVEFNDSLAGTFNTGSFCNCGFRRNIIAVEVPPFLYQVRGQNRFLIANPQSCQGMMPDADLGQAYARITVEYTGGGEKGGGGGGGEVDLTPVLERLDELEAKIDSSEASTTAHVSAEHEATRDLIQGFLFAYLLEQDVASGGQGMTAVACLPEEHGGHLEETIAVVFETIEGHALAGCDVSDAEAHFQRGSDELASGHFVKACDWFRKAYKTADESCP